MSAPVLFYEQQRRARRISGIIYICLLLYALVFSFLVSAVIVAVFEHYTGNFSWRYFWRSIWDIRVHGPIAILNLIVLLAIQQTKFWELQKGGVATAITLRARRIYPSTTTDVERMAMNVLSEMSLAAGIPLPLLFVVPGEKSINAFAAGSELSNSVVGITEGALQKLTRDEMQAVFAHEISHIINKDLTLNNHITAFVAAVDVLRRSGLRIIENQHARNVYARHSFGPGILVVLGYTGHECGKFLQACASRQREYLADGSAVQFTRNPTALASLLRKISEEQGAASWQRSQTELLQHSFFHAAFPDYIATLFATHPPIGKRIRALGKDAVESSRNFSPLHREYSGAIPRIERREIISQTLVATQLLDPSGILEGLHMHNATLLPYAHKLLEQLPAIIVDAMRNPYGARALIYTLLLHQDQSIRIQQLNAFLPNEDYFVKEEVARLIPIVEKLPKGRLLPLVDLSMPALLELSPPEREFFSKNLSLVARQGNENPLRFGLLAILDKRLFHEHPLHEAKLLSDKQFQKLALCLLSHLAHISTKSAGLKEQEIEKLLEILGLSTHIDPGYRKVSWQDFLEMCHSLRFVNESQARRLLTACDFVLRLDGHIHPEEYECMRCMCEIMEIPMLPIDPLALHSPDALSQRAPVFRKSGW